MQPQGSTGDESQPFPTILVVEDEKYMQHILAILLERSRFQVVAKADADSALTYLNSNQVQLAILDILMPGEMNGIELCRTIRTVYSKEELPIVVLSGAGEEFLQQGRLAGANIALSKPFSPVTLLQTINRLLVVHQEDKLK